MTSYSEDLRNIMNRLDTIEETAEETFGSGDAARILEEDFTTDIKAIFGDEHAKGSKARELLAKRFSKEWKDFLGRTDRSGTPEDMERFLLKRVGFDPADLDVILGKGLSAPDQSTAKVTTAKADGSKSDDREEPIDQDEMEVQAAPETDPKEKNSDDARFRKSDGTVDMRAVRKELSKMNPGERLHIDGKTYFVGGDDEHVPTGTRTVPAESLEERDMLGERQLMEFDIRKPISGNTVKSILNRAAAHAFDTYLMNRPSDAGAYGGYEGGEEEGDGGHHTLGGSSRSAGARSTNAAKVGGNIDLDRMWRAIENEGLDTDDVKTLKQVVSSTRGLKSIKDPGDVKMLAAIGYAFLKARK